MQTTKPRQDNRRRRRTTRAVSETVSSAQVEGSGMTTKPRSPVLCVKVQVLSPLARLPTLPGAGTGGRAGKFYTQRQKLLRIYLQRCVYQGVFLIEAGLGLKAGLGAG